MRSPFDLANITPESKNIGGDNGFILGGGQAASYGTTLDGVSTNTSRALSMSWVSSNAPSLEAITEFTVDTNGFKAEYGHAGGGVMTFSSKSGTNQFHGSAYEFLRNNDFDANRFFSNRPAFPSPSTSRAISAAASAAPSTSRRFTTARTRASSSSPTKASATASAPPRSPPPSPPRKCTTETSASGSTRPEQQIPIYDPTTQTINASTGAVTRTPFANNQIPQALIAPDASKGSGRIRQRRRRATHAQQRRRSRHAGLRHQ